LRIAPPTKDSMHLRRWVDTGKALIDRIVSRSAGSSARKRTCGIGDGIEKVVVPKSRFRFSSSPPLVHRKIDDPQARKAIRCRSISSSSAARPVPGGNAKCAMNSPGTGLQMKKKTASPSRLQAARGCPSVWFGNDVWRSGKAPSPVHAGREVERARLAFGNARRVHPVAGSRGFARRSATDGTAHTCHLGIGSRSGRRTPLKPALIAKQSVDQFRSISFGFAQCRACRKPYFESRSA